MLAAVFRSALVTILAAGLVGGCALRPVTMTNATPLAPRVLTGWRTRPPGDPPFDSTTCAAKYSSILW